MKYAILIINILLIGIAFNPIFSQEIKEIKFIGEQKDVQRITSLCNDCIRKSPAFRFIIKNLIKEQVPIKVEVKNTAYSFGVFSWVRIGEEWKPHTIYLEPLLFYPISELDKDGITINLPSNIPIWANTQCVLLSHELAEALYGYKFKGKFQKFSEAFSTSHEYGISTENEVKSDIYYSLKNNKGKCQFRPKEKSDFSEIWIPHENHNDVILEVGGHYEVLHLSKYIEVSYIERADMEVEHKWMKLEFKLPRN